jgi:SAM-dependent methyltransferase
MPAVQYQERFSETHAGEMYDAETRRLKAAKAIAILQDCLGDLSGLRLLDLGCSNGLMTRFYGEAFEDVIGLDIDAPGIAFAQANNTAPNIRYELSDGMNTGLPDESIDVVTCTHVYEHVPDAMHLLDEIHRVLRPGGACLFIAGNRLTWMEADNHLPLLSVLPRPLADRYVRLAGKGDRYYERTRSLWGLRRLVSRFEVRDYSLRVLQEPERFHMTELVRPGTLKQKASILALRAAYWLSPTFIWILVKPTPAVTTSRP